jgi:hypothetical protein
MPISHKNVRLKRFLKACLSCWLNIGIPTGEADSAAGRPTLRRENRRTAQLSVASSRENGLPNEAFDRQAGVDEAEGRGGEKISEA